MVSFIVLDLPAGVDGAGAAATATAAAPTGAVNNNSAHVVDVNIRDSTGWTALHCAAFQVYYTCMEERACCGVACEIK